MVSATSSEECIFIEWVVDLEIYFEQNLGRQLCERHGLVGEVDVVVMVDFWCGELYEVGSEVETRRCGGDASG